MNWKIINLLVICLSVYPAKAKTKINMKIKKRGYGGYEKQKLYLYNSNGKYIKNYESKTEFCKDYFPNDSEIRPLFVKTKWNSRANFGYQLLTDGCFVCNFRAGREYIRKTEYIVNSVFCKYLKEKPIEVFNLAGDKIAEFLNLHIATNITNIPKGTIVSQLTSKNISAKKSNLIFKYKKNEI